MSNTSPTNPNEPSGQTPPNLTLPSMERITNITLGMGAVVVEKFEHVAEGLDEGFRRVLSEAPTFADTLEEKGRPIREKIAAIIQNRPTVADVFTANARMDLSKDTQMTDLEKRVEELENERDTQGDRSATMPSDSDHDTPE